MRALWDDPPTSQPEAGDQAELETFAQALAANTDSPATAAIPWPVAVGVSVRSSAELGEGTVPGIAELIASARVCVWDAAENAPLAHCEHGLAQLRSFVDALAPGG